MSEKQDRIYPRTAADLERKYNYEKRFAEIMGVALDAQKHVEESEALMKAELSLKLGYDENDKIVSMLNASADIINIRGDRLTIDSTHFTLEEDGKVVCSNIYASGGNIGGCSFDEFGRLEIPATLITGRIKADQIEAIDISTKDLYVEDLYLLSNRLCGWDISSTSLESMFIDENQDSTHFHLKLNSNVGAGDNFIEVYAENDDYTDYNDTFFTLSSTGAMLVKDITLINTIKYRRMWENENNSGTSTYELYLDYDTNTVKFRLLDSNIDDGGDTGDDETYVTVDGNEYYDVVGVQSEFPYSKAHDEYFQFYITGQANTVYSCLTIKANGDVYYNTTLVYDASENLVTEGMDGYIQPVGQSVDMTEEFGNWFKSTMVEDGGGYEGGGAGGDSGDDEPTVWGVFTFGDNDLGGHSFYDDDEGDPYVRYNGNDYIGIGFDSSNSSDGDDELYLYDEDSYYSLYNASDGWNENPITLEFLVEPSSAVKTFIETYKNGGTASKPTEYVIKAGTYTLHNDGRDGNPTDDRCVIFSEEEFYCEGYSDGYEFGVEEDGSLFVEGGDCYTLPIGNKTITVYEDVIVSKTQYDIFKYYTN